jgi:hypothetical protein
MVVNQLIKVKENVVVGQFAFSALVAGRLRLTLNELRRTESAPAAN